MTEEFKTGLPYNSLVSARSTLGHCLPCNIINHSTAQHSPVFTFLKGVYNLRPPTPKYVAIWNVNTLLSHIEHKDISTFYDITKKLATLFDSCIIHSYRYITDTEVSFTFDEVHKHSRPNYKQKPLIFRAFTSRDLCPVTTLIAYLEHRIPVSGDPALCIITVKPHKKASKDSISRRIKLCLKQELILDFLAPIAADPHLQAELLRHI